MTKNKKLTAKDFERMWGEDGPYSQVRLSEETRILDDSVSRVFLVVEAEINPFTFEYIKKNRRRFANDESILQILEHAQYRDEFGYVVSAGEAELRDEEAVKFARERADATIQTLIRMHTFVMNECGLNKKEKFGIVENKTPVESRFVWNQITGRVEPLDDESWNSEAFVGSSVGIQDSKTRFYFVLAYASRGFRQSKNTALSIVDGLKAAAARLKVKVEEVESFQEYFLATVFLPFDVSPEDFAMAVLDECNKNAEGPIFQKDYLVTNIKRPTPYEIMAFLGQSRKKGMKNTRSVEEEFLDRPHAQACQVIKEKQPTMEKILERREELEREIKEMLKITESDFEFEDVVDAIYNEEETDDMTKIIAMFDRGGDASELENVLELITDAWNYFPHKILGGLSPVERM